MRWLCRVAPGDKHGTFGRRGNENDGLPLRFMLGRKKTTRGSRLSMLFSSLFSTESSATRDSLLSGRHLPHNGASAAAPSSRRWRPLHGGGTLLSGNATLMVSPRMRLISGTLITMVVATYPQHGALPLALRPHKVRVARSNCHKLEVSEIEAIRWICDDFEAQFLNIDLGSKQSTRLDESSRARCFFSHELPIDADSQSGCDESPHRTVFVLPVGESDIYRRHTERPQEAKNKDQGLCSSSGPREHQNLEH
ncbi:hypothetical protein OsJ_27848 [Oryza sativa Japonica Group]|uniref:Uncharacterized protein n=1 Tax=Oryza sativa subsp. japonica TaxID=39947 RepID=B9G1N9_ORYSJ|nr:hypothetical protein OsJ_27848 [Oryza sativa Japonica Group]